MRFISGLFIGALLVAAPVDAGDGPQYWVTAPDCYDGDGQSLGNPSATGSYATVKAWIRKQQRGGPKDVRDGICEHWINVWTILVRDPLPDEITGEPVWDWYRGSYGCR